MDSSESKESALDLHLEIIEGLYYASKEVQTTITLLDELPSKRFNHKNGTSVNLNQETAEIIPKTEGEIQLYLVLERANLLEYFNTFVSQGGDDVQQICEAGKEEFLEILSLVGMSQKPLHVRRLQKTLQEWVTNPSVFQNGSSKFVQTPLVCPPPVDYNPTKTLPPPSNECSLSETMIQGGSSSVLNLSLNNQSGSFLDGGSNQWCSMPGPPESSLSAPSAALTPSSDGFLSPSKSEDGSEFSAVANTDSPTSTVTVSESNDANTDSEFTLAINTDSSGERQVASPLIDSDYQVSCFRFGVEDITY